MSNDWGNVIRRTFEGDDKPLPKSPVEQLKIELEAERSAREKAESEAKAWRELFEAREAHEEAEESGLYDDSKAAHERLQQAERQMIELGIWEG